MYTINAEIHIYPKEKMLAMIRATIVDQEKFRWLPPSLITDFHQGRHRMFACREKNNQLINYLHHVWQPVMSWQCRGLRESPALPSPDRSFIAAEKFPDLFCALSPTATRPLKAQNKANEINGISHTFPSLLFLDPSGLLFCCVSYK